MANDFVKRMAKAKAQLSHEEKVKENRRIFEMALAQIEFPHVQPGVQISCDGNQRNFQLEIDGVSPEKCAEIAEGLDKMFDEIREVSMQIGDAIMHSGNADEAIEAYRQSKGSNPE